MHRTLEIKIKLSKKYQFHSKKIIKPPKKNKTLDKIIISPKQIIKPPKKIKPSKKKFKKTTDKPIKWIICFSPVLSKVFVEKNFTKKIVVFNKLSCKKLNSV